MCSKLAKFDGKTPPFWINNVSNDINSDVFRVRHLVKARKGANGGDRYRAHFESMNTEQPVCLGCGQLPLAGAGLMAAVRGGGWGP